MKKKLKSGGAASQQDSLDVYNNSKAVNDYYKKKGYTTISDKPFVGDISKYLDSIGDTYSKKIDGNREMHRESDTTQVDLQAPLTLYDRRINPQRQVTYRNEIPGSPLVGDIASLPQYDPIAVKPYYLLNPQEKALRDSKYSGMVDRGRNRPLKPVETLPAQPLPTTQEITPLQPVNVGKYNEHGHSYYYGNMGQPVTIDGVEQKAFGGMLAERSTDMKKTPRKILNKVMPLAYNGLDTTGNIPSDVTAGYNYSKTDTALANDPVAQQQMKPNQGLPGVSPINPTQDPMVQNAPMQPTDNSQSTTPRRRNPISGSFDTSEVIPGILGGINSLLQSTPPKSNINYNQYSYNEHPNGIQGSQAIFEDGGQVRYHVGKPKIGFVMAADGTQLSPMEMDAYNAFHTQEYQKYGPTYGGDTYNHGQFANPDLQAWNQQHPQQQVDLQRIQAAPGSIDPLGRTPQDMKVGPQTMAKNFMNYATEHYDRYGKLVKEDSKFFGTDQAAASKQHNTNILGGIQPVQQPKQWQSNDQGIPIDAPMSQTQSFSAKTQKSNYHTNENADYSVDSVREAKSGIHIKPSHKGLLHKHLGVKEGHKLSAKQIAVHKGDSAKTKKQKIFAQNARKWHHKEDGGEIDLNDYEAKAGISFPGKVHQVSGPYGSTVPEHYTGFVHADAGLTLLNNGSIDNLSGGLTDTPVIKFNGPSHEDGGIPIDYNDHKVEVEGDETMAGNTVFGNMKMPNLGEITKDMHGKKFKKLGEELGEKEGKNAKTATKAAALMSFTNPTNKISSLSFITGSVLADGASQNQSAYEAQKSALAAIQQNMLELSKQSGTKPEDMHKQFKMGGNIFRDGGKTRGDDTIGDEFTNDDYTQMGKNNIPKKMPKKGASKVQIGNATIPNAAQTQNAGSPWDIMLNQLSQGMQSPVQTLGVPYNPNYIAPLDYAPLKQMPAAPEQFKPAVVPDSQMPNKYTGVPTRNTTKPPSLADENKLGVSDFLPALPYIFGRPDPVVRQQYNPKLLDPYQVSFQDRKNDNQSTFNSLQGQLAQHPASLASLAAQKYNADNSVNAEEFRTNQGIANQVTNANSTLMNEAQKMNLGLADQQYTRQAQAKSNTDAKRAQALSYISDMISENRRENMDIRLVEQKDGGYRWNPKTQKMEWFGPNANFNTQYGQQPSYANNNDDVTKEYDADGNLTKTIKKSKQLATSKWGNIFLSK